MTLIPEGETAVVDSNPLEIDETKRTEMLTQAKTLFTKTMEKKELMNALEKHYTAKNIHYTSAQLGDIVLQVENDLVEIIE